MRDGKLRGFIVGGAVAGVVGAVTLVAIIVGDRALGRAAVEADRRAAEMTGEERLAAEAACRSAFTRQFAGGGYAVLDSSVTVTRNRLRTLVSSRGTISNGSSGVRHVGVVCDVELTGLSARVRDLRVSQ